MIATTQGAGRAAGASRARARAGAPRRGSVLVEFALIAIAFYLLLAGTLEVGRMITTSQIVQNAARTAARELALMPLPATMTFEEALACPVVRARIYDPGLLCVPLPQSTQAFTDDWPIVNRLLLPVMVAGKVGQEDVLHYPGAIIQRSDDDDGRSVAVPKVVARGADGVETVRWVEVLEEVEPSSGGPMAGPFSVASTGPERGLVALRINCAYQASTLTAYQPQPIDTTTPDNRPILAQDGGVSQQNSAPGSLVGNDAPGAYSGQYGLGKHYALSKEVRPFRRLISGQSIFRREVFSAGTACPPH